ncbi:hypothetical protein BG011_002958 [Mortierella polycephala]|uniref:Cation efflux protein cytoplasmic domain-containing protein n=1 Tax=Mortierella polycephala TaxID=41804 RepID=A0A9P6Q4T5_9FUNG|nr:hypothetical protein BG011_002958 [Mortierella polycephala]
MTGKGKKQKGRSKNAKVTIAPQEPKPIEDLVPPPPPPPPASVIVHMEPPTPSTEASVIAVEPGTMDGFIDTSKLMASRTEPQHSSSCHPHDHPEPSIGERFGRRHGKDWPVSLGLDSRCASCPGSRSASRSKSRGRRRTSGVLYKVIPSRPVMGPQVFQAARKSEEEIRAFKNKPQVRQYYQSLNEVLDSFAEVEEILRDHKEEEQANATKQLQLPPLRDALHSRSSTSDVQSFVSYGLMPQTPSPGDVAIHGYTRHVSNRSYGEDNDDPGSLEEAPLLEYKKKQRTSSEQVQLAINVSFIANIFLFILKIWTVMLSDSLAVLASMIDSLMDLLSSAIIWYSARLRSNTLDRHIYPVGKARMEPLGIIVFAVVMVTSFMQVMVQAFERLLVGSAEPPVDLSVTILLLLALNILVKLALWLWCRTMKDSSSVQALAQDHLNDVIFNVFSTLFPVVGQFLEFWWMDAAGAIVLSIYIISEWTSTCLHNIRRLTGQAATPADIQQLTYMTYRFSNTIQVIDTVRAYSVGQGLFAEVDIVLPPDTPLSQAHDLGESLQDALEKLDNVERAFVHIDYNAVHAIEH